MNTITKKSIAQNIRSERKGFSDWFYTYTNQYGDQVHADNQQGKTKRDFVNDLYILMNK